MYNIVNGCLFSLFRYQIESILLVLATEVGPTSNPYLHLRHLSTSFILLNILSHAHSIYSTTTEISSVTVTQMSPTSQGFTTNRMPNRETAHPGKSGTVIGSIMKTSGGRDQKKDITCSHCQMIIAGPTLIPSILPPVTWGSVPVTSGFMRGSRLDVPLHTVTTNTEKSNRPRGCGRKTLNC